MDALDKVALVACPGYGRQETYERVKESLDLLGGIGHFFRSGERVLLKPNVLMAGPPEDAVVTHPDVVYAVARLLQEAGCMVIIGESPGAGSLYTPGSLEKAYEVTGYAQVAKDLDIILNYDTSYVEMTNPEGKMIKRFLVIGPATEVDAIVVVSKLKTHLFTYLTGATKNLFGLVPGLEKATFHGRLPEPKDFAEMLVDLNLLLKPRLQVMDGIMGMEGDGPYSGTPRRVGAVLASPSYSALDVIVARLIHMDPERIPTVQVAQERGLLPKDLDSIEVVGEKVEKLQVTDFRMPSTYNKSRGGLKRIERGLLRLARVYALRPLIVKEACTDCGRCVRACPKGAIKSRSGKAKVNQRRCIRCYTCHEMCTSHAIRLERSMTGRMVAKLVERGGKD